MTEVCHFIPPLYYSSIVTALIGSQIQLLLSSQLGGSREGYGHTNIFDNLF